MDERQMIIVEQVAALAHQQGLTIMQCIHWLTSAAVVGGDWDLLDELNELRGRLQLEA